MPTTLVITDTEVKTTIFEVIYFRLYLLYLASILSTSKLQQIQHGRFFLSRLWNFSNFSRLLTPFLVYLINENLD